MSCIPCCKWQSQSKRDEFDVNPRQSNVQLLACRALRAAGAHTKESEIEHRQICSRRNGLFQSVLQIKKIESFHNINAKGRALILRGARIEIPAFFEHGSLAIHHADCSHRCHWGPLPQARGAHAATFF
jgi:hypothetical protein